MTTPERARAVDWAATFVAVILAALLVGLPGAGGAESAGTLAAVRTLEQKFKLLDAEAALPPEIRDRIGLVGEPDEVRSRVVDTLTRGIERSRGTPALLVVATAIAVGVGEDAVALETLDSLADEPDDLAAYPGLADDLHRMAGGQPARDIGRLTTGLLDLGASRWLARRVEARHYTLEGDPELGAAALDTATALAMTFVERFTWLLILRFSFMLVGAAILIFWPLVRRALHNAGLAGLGTLPSPFATASTHRVMIFWFLAFLMVGLLTSLASMALGADARANAINLTAQTLIQGGIAIALIQRYARPADDALPLTIPLRLTAGPGVGGLLGVFLWSLGGLAVGLVVVTSVTIVAAGLFGAPDESQQALQLFAEQGDLETRLVIGAAAVIFAPVFEEIVFRGFLYRNLRDLTGPLPAMLLSGAVFGFVHLQPGVFLPLAALGAVLAFLFERSGSLWVCVIVHGVWNLGQLVFAGVLAAG